MAIAADLSAGLVATARGQILKVSGKRNRVAALIEAGGLLDYFGQTIAVGSTESGWPTWSPHYARSSASTPGG